MSLQRKLAETSRKVDQAVIRIEELFGIIRQKGQIPIMEIREEVLPVIYEITENAAVFPLLLSLRAKNDYIFRHPFAVGVIACMLGRWLELPENEQAILTVGALLHNVGKMRISESILHKKGPLDEDELENMKKHTVIGYEMLDKTVGVAKRSALIALQHHEREDGTGYPLRLTGAQTDILSKITAVADVFHALSCHRAYRDATPFYEILRHMYNGSLGRFDSQILTTFTRRIMNAMVGSEVELTDGRRGTIVLINPSDPTAPLIKIGSQFLDLRLSPDVHMEAILG